MILTPPPESIVAFYAGQEADDVGRRIEDIWMADDAFLEGTHDYIQWLFPLKEPSQFNVFAPVLNEQVISTFRASEDLKRRLLVSFEMMLKFYGFKMEEVEAQVRISESDDFTAKKRNWLNPGNHNYLRITRILTCLRLLGLEQYSQAFFACLTKVYEVEPGPIGNRTFDFWRKTQL
jgi:hypothetical protein